MGLDGVEIVMRTEETFGIEIPDKIAQQILTPAALVDFVAANVPLKPTEECLSQQLFYRFAARIPIAVEGALFDV